MPSLSLAPDSLTPPARSIHPRGQRFGAATSAIVLGPGVRAQRSIFAVLVGLNLAIASALGARFFLPGWPWPLVRRTLGLGPTQPEHEYPPRFAQALGATCLGFSALAFVAGVPALGWLFVAAVGALQTVLAVTGFCLGCRMYFLRWWVPSLFARVFRRGDRVAKLNVAPLRRG